MSSVTKENVINFIENMSVLELSQLVKELEEKYLRKNKNGPN